MLLPGLAAGEVVARAPGGFVVAEVLTLEAPPARAFEALTEEVGAWWDVAHSYSGDGANLTLDASAGGCFCERLPGGGGVEHMRVVFAAPGKTLRLEGGLGPLRQMGAYGVMEFQLEPADDGARLTFRYTVSGYAPDGLDAVAEPVDRVLRGQLSRLADYLAARAEARH